MFSSMSELMRYVASQITPNGIHCALCYCGGICCLLPVILYPKSYLEDSRLRASLPATQIRDSSVAVISLVFPLIMDIITEIVNSFFKIQSGIVCKQTKPLLNNVEKLLFLCGTVCVPLTSCTQSSSHNWAYMYLCSQQCQFTMAGGAIYTSLSRYNPEYFTVKKTYLILSLWTSGTICRAFSGNYILIADRAQYLVHLETGSYYLILTAALVFTLCAGGWLRESVPKFVRVFRFYPKVQSGCKQKIQTESLLFPIVFVLTSLVAASMLLLVQSLYNGAQNFDVKALYIHNLAFLIYLLFITYGSMRMMKYEVVQGLYALIESKKMYVRYISHELRTPLNSACLGLQLVSNAFPDAEDYNAERSEILQDVKSACRTAVEILDDLLCFDKLESGILEVHKHEVPVVQFICEGVDLFSSQAKEAGVFMSVEMPSVDMHGATMMPLLDTDHVLMDKFKMDQVLRNLISNALKFTPKGGSVSVSASFVPDTIFEPKKDLNKEKSIEIDIDSSPEKSPPLLKKWISRLQKSQQFFSSFMLNPSRASSNSKIHISDHSEDLEMGRLASLRCPPSRWVINTYNNNNNSNKSVPQSQCHFTRKTRRGSVDGENLDTSIGNTSIGNNDDYSTYDFSGLAENDIPGHASNLNSINSNRIIYERAQEFIGNTPEMSKIYGRRSIDIYDGNRSIMNDNRSTMNSPISSGMKSITSREQEKKPYFADSCRYRISKFSGKFTKNKVNQVDPDLCGSLVIIVTDTGAGISEQNIQRLFKEIVQFTPEKLQAGGGSGLGLWITKSLVNLHNGSVNAHSDGEGKGSSFKVCIPMYRRSGTSGANVLASDLLSQNSRNSGDFRDSGGVSGGDDSPDRISKCVILKALNSESKDKDHPSSISNAFGSNATLSNITVCGTTVSRTTGSSMTLETDDTMMTNESNEQKDNNEGKEITQSNGRRDSRDKLSPSIRFSSTSDRSNPCHYPGWYNVNNAKNMNNIQNTNNNAKNMNNINNTNNNTNNNIQNTNNNINSDMNNYLNNNLNNTKNPVVNGGRRATLDPIQTENNSLVIPNDTTPTTPACHYNILVVDDSSLNRKMLCRILTKSGHTCDEADDGLSAVEKVKLKIVSTDIPYDAIMMDFVMPNMDGPTATKIIREMGYSGPIFGVTGNALDSDITYFLNHGADHILPKPFDFKKFNMLMNEGKESRERKERKEKQLKNHRCST